MSGDPVNPPWARFRWLGLVIVGLVIGGLAVIAWRGWRIPIEGGRQGYVVTITHGPKDPDRVMLALVTASRLPAGDNHVWFAIDGGQLCKKGDAEKISSPLFTKQGNAAKVIEQLRAKGVAIHI